MRDSSADLPRIDVSAFVSGAGDRAATARAIGTACRRDGFFYAELTDDDPRVRAGLPLHGPNQLPELPGFRSAVLEYLGALTRLGRQLMEGVALSLVLDAH